MSSNDTCEGPEGIICLTSPGKDSGDVRIEGDHETALCVAGGVLVGPRSAEVVLVQNLVNLGLKWSHPFSFGLPHIPFAHGALLFAR
jgi:hypothetical protein